MDLPPERSAPSHARRFVRQTLESWGVHGDAAADAELLASELVTNAVLHAGSGTTLTIEQRGGRVRITVADTSAIPPVLREYDPEAASGRGLLLVERLAVEWGIDDDGADGKRIWFEFDPSTGGRLSSREVRA
jgi:anti-sigma regulatory factor (Ser/Thr protein kinase)